MKLNLTADAGRPNTLLQVVPFEDDTIYLYSNLSFQLRMRPPLLVSGCEPHGWSAGYHHSRIILTFFGASMEMELRGEQDSQFDRAGTQSDNGFRIKVPERFVSTGEK